MKQTPYDVPASSTLALLETQEMLAAIGRIQAQLLTGNDSQAAFDALLGELLRVSGSAIGFIGEVRHDEHDAPWLRIHTISDVAWDEPSRARMQGRSGGGMEFRRLDTLIGTVLRSAQVAIANDPARDPRSGGLPDGHPQIASFLGIPFVHREQLIGVVGLANRPGGYTQDVVDLLQPMVETVRTVVVAHRAERSRARAEAAVVRLNRSLQANVAKLERINQLNRALSQLRDRLQASPSVAALCAVAEAFSGTLLGGLGGCVALCEAQGASAGNAAPDGGPGPDRADAQSGGLSVVHCWGDAPPAQGCEGAEVRPAIDPESRLLSAPLVAQGDRIGVLRVRLPAPPAAAAGDDAEAAGAAADAQAGAGVGSDAERLRLAGILAMHLSMAISNVRMRDTLRAQAIRDPLTGLYNRRHMDEVFEREVRRALRSGEALAVFMVDIDRFKRINDGFGHEAGDLVIRTLAHCLAGTIRHEDYAFRFGGEEFLLLMPGVDAAAMPARARAVLAAVRRLSICWEGRPLGDVTVSIGAAALPAHGSTPAELLRAADEAMYRAKQGGRDRAVCA
ncbi:sensor domain-containing diguanylate cyclase [Quisquiliibacterium transsilvanicum]|uniref:diguanylate cyclase n=1 Tax=Quisquiliibacterium transsilvanicum TaxID=1549638 RepID=A0A7W8HK32_9BURK|nr:sensor domain-containing diguanylate cyclase [Quisquiliibacterium transsilvanicum]MBB5273519.1 diguanylate cyclase (GGDEF)-like protein [Quisquiliibacterium transsilvanicum]